MITALGDTVEANYRGLCKGIPALSSPRFLDTIHRDLPVGEVCYSNSELYEMAGLRGGFFSRTELLGLIALQEALAGWPREVLARERVAFVNATTVGGIGEVEKVYPELLRARSSAESLKISETFDCAHCTHQLADHFGLQGYRTTISTACSSSANALLHAAELLRQDQADLVICGGTDALSRFTLNGFHSLKNVDAGKCRPFDEHRGGLNLGEGAAYLVLERESAVRGRQGQALAYFPGGANTNEAYHPTAPSPDGAGALRTMQEALQQAGVKPDQVDYINAHGTATAGNDLAEGMAIQRLFGDRPPPFSSTKSYIGHTLAASGSVEAIFTCLSLKYGFIPPNLGFKEPMRDLKIRPAAELERADINIALSNSFGFGGSDVSLIFRKA